MSLIVDLRPGGNILFKRCYSPTSSIAAYFKFLGGDFESQESPFNSTLPYPREIGLKVIGFEFGRVNFAGAQAILFF